MKVTVKIICEGIDEYTQSSESSIVLNSEPDDSDSFTIANAIDSVLSNNVFCKENILEQLRQINQTF